MLSGEGVPKGDAVPQSSCLCVDVDPPPLIHSGRMGGAEKAGNGSMCGGGMRKRDGQWTPSGAGGEAKGLRGEERIWGYYARASAESTQRHKSDSGPSGRESG